mmetsp:Transcript_4533/g.10565  ORF Transcript_4533/g.10565 Transcript_4533/m.10565 type:complete len:96 (+) Transcript_4533:109-396(+)
MITRGERPLSRQDALPLQSTGQPSASVPPCLAQSGRDFRPAYCLLHEFNVAQFLCPPHRPQQKGPDQIAASIAALIGLSKERFQNCRVQTSFFIT